MTRRVGCVGYATDQGLGYLAKSFYDNGLIDKMLIVHHPARGANAQWYPEGTPVLHSRPFPDDQVQDFMSSVDVVIFFETPFDWAFPHRLKKRGIKTVLVPMYEWSLETPPFVFDLYACPSDLDLDYFGSKYRCTRLDIPVDPEAWDLRKTCKRFVHNAGHVGSRRHKGTTEVMRAMRYAKGDFELTIRCQEAEWLRQEYDRSPWLHGDPRVVMTYGQVPYENLFTGFDAMVAPEKYNGLSLPLQEAYSSGLFVITTDRYPANRWLPPEGLVKPRASVKTRVGRSYLEIEESVVDPEDVAAKMDEWTGKDITPYSLKAYEWAQANSWDALKPSWLAALEAA